MGCSAIEEYEEEDNIVSFGTSPYCNTQGGTFLQLTDKVS
jgi:hypothetical protein